MLDSMLVTSQEPLLANNPSYSLVTVQEEHNDTTYEPIDRADSTLHVASNPIYGQQTVAGDEHEYAYPEAKLVPDHSDIVSTGANNYYEPTPINQ